jgi:macrolide transport system ATP-binding/permease protein
MKRRGFFMLILEANNLKKYYGDRLIFDIENLKIYSEDRIGVVGLNGAGKTTLLDVLSGKSDADEGIVKLHGSLSYIEQLGLPEERKLDSKSARTFGTGEFVEYHMSGGEKTRFKLAQVFSREADLIIADEPTSNLDIPGVALIEEKFKFHKGALLLISHDREFLDKMCNKIIELDQGKVKVYNGNYSQYRELKQKERDREAFEYNAYQREKARLEEAIIEKTSKVKGMKKAPSRMGNSEARLHKMGNQKAKANLERAVKNLESRIEHLEVKEKPKDIVKSKIDIQSMEGVHSKILISGKGINKSFGDKVIFDGAEFEIYRGTKIAFIGDNGSGKSTLLRMIINKEDCIILSKVLKIGYFSQELDILQEGLTILENAMNTSKYDETYVRIVLSRLLFKREEIYKKVGVLSGGERVKVSFAKILLQDINLLILDEPTNYLDIYSTEAVETALREYEGTVLFVSHDRRFIKNIADHLLILKDRKLIGFNGSYEEYENKLQKKSDGRVEVKEQIMRMENRLTELIGKLSMPSKKDDVTALDEEYNLLLRQLKGLKNN